MTSSVDLELRSYLDRFGLAEFRPGQREVISAVLAGRNCLCIMPTGGGKSLCYQLPAIARPGVTLVVSPLISLMKDQVDALHQQGISAACINSSQAPEEQADRMRRLRDGEFELVYIAPERFRSSHFLDAIDQLEVSLLAVDEAHCVSQWGHDFRPDYARLDQFRKRLNNPQTIALTATATPVVRSDVIKLLGLEDPEIFVTGFARPNLIYGVDNCSSRRDKDDELIEFLRGQPGCGIVYVSSRDRCDALAKLIRERLRRQVGTYHAGMKPEERKRSQDEFMQGRLEIVVATVAFGMGIDKANVRFVAHYNMPGTIEAYYQEAGRAGRDGLPSTCLLLYSTGDRYIQEYFIENAYPSEATVRQVYDYLRRLDEDPIEVTQLELKDRLQLELGADGVGACEQLLEKHGALERLEAQQNMAAIRLDSDEASLVDLLPRQAAIQRKVVRGLNQMVGARRRERIFFQPAALAQLLDMDAPQLHRTLRELSRHEWIDYVPPFRGRAVRVLGRERPFEQLHVDFTELNRRRAAELEKLEQVIGYARGRDCREQQILKYFGETESPRCGRCDNCATRDQSNVADEVPALADDDPLADAVRIVLSGVARVERKFASRDLGFGKQAIAQMLCGSKSSRMTRWGLDQFSTFGLLGNLRQTDVSCLIDALLEVDLISQEETQRFRPVLRLTDRGTQVMRDVRELAEPLKLSDPLLRKIRHARSPATSRRVAAPSPARQPVSDSGVSTDAQPSYYWTWRLLAAGFTIDECRRIRRHTSAEIWDHAELAVENGLHLDPSWLLSSRQIEILDVQLAANPATDVDLLLERLTEPAAPEAVRLYSRSRARRTTAKKGRM